MKTAPHRLSIRPNVMPDLMESSENEDNDEDTPPENGQNNEQVFPCLPDCILKKLSVHKDKVISDEKLTEKEIENKFNVLSLAFKTDRFTLSTRLELLQRHRNTAEENIESELQHLRDAVNMLNHFVPNTVAREIFTNIQQQIDVVQQSVNRLSGRAEMYGAVQQEERLSKAAEVMVTHVENLKRLREKERCELEETRRLLIETRILSGEKRDDAALSRSPLIDSCGTPRTATVSRRRASVAGFHRPLMADVKMPITANNWLMYNAINKPVEVKRSLVGSFSLSNSNTNSSPESSPPAVPPKISILESPPGSSITEESPNKVGEESNNNKDDK